MDNVTPLDSIVEIKVKDRLDRTFSLYAQAGIKIKTWFQQKSIPSAAILLRINGEITDDAHYVVSSGDEISVDMVRAYQLPEYCSMLEHWEDRIDFDAGHEDSIYTSQTLWNTDSGISELYTTNISRKNYRSWLENKFIDGIVEKGLFENDETVCLALSGGRDSLALLYMLRRTREKLPNINLVGCTVAATAASQNDVKIATEAIVDLGVEDFTVLDTDYLNSTFDLKHGFQNAIESVLENAGRGVSIASWHSIMRTCVENFARSRGIKKIVFGYQHEDLLASIIRSQSLGITFGESPYKKSWGEFTIVAPLWTITKKELTIYLDQTAEVGHSSQGSPTNFDRGDHNRDINYYLADSICSLVPGYGFQMLEGAEMASNYESALATHKTCSKCNGIFQVFENHEHWSGANNLYCPTCTFLFELKETDYLR